MEEIRNEMHIGRAKHVGKSNGVDWMSKVRRCEGVKAWRRLMMKEEA